MATDDSDSSATIVQLHPPKPKTAAERGRAFRARRREAKAAPTIDIPPPAPAALASPVKSPNFGDLKSPKLGGLPAIIPVSTSVRLPPVVFEPVSYAVRIGGISTANAAANGERGVQTARIGLSVAAFGLAGIGVILNGWFARSLGSTDIAGWLFLGTGALADLAALTLPSCAAHLWHAGKRPAAAFGWTIWTAIFAFVVLAGIGFVSTNVADVTLARSGRITPAITTAQAGLADAVAARDRECRGGVGRNCREREVAVADRRQALDVAMAGIERVSDPQTTAAVRAVVWLTRGAVRPDADDFATLRLILFSLLPQAGGVLLMLARAAR